MMHALIVLAGIVLFLWTLPLTLELLVLTAATFASFSDAPETFSTGTPLRLNIVIAAHNEEKLIARTIASLKAGGACEDCIHVIAHNCDANDRTAGIALDAGAGVTALDGPSGKGHALLYAFTHPIGSQAPDAFMVIDADTIVTPDLIPRVTAALARYEAVQCRYEALPETGESAQLTALAFRAFNFIRPRGREKLGLSCGILGNGFAFRASVLEHVPYNAHSIVEDVEFHLDLVRAGIRVHFLDDVALYGEIAGSRSQHARWEGGRLRLARQKLPGVLKDILSGKLRLIEPALDLACTPQAQGILLLLLALLLPLPWMRIYALSSLLIVVLHIALALLISPEPGAAFRALLRAPLYIVRKLTGARATLRSASDSAEWQRAERDSRPEGKS